MSLNNTDLRIALINPNSTESMTLKARDAAQGVVGSGIQVDGITCSDGPASIQGPEDGEAAVPGLLEQIAEADRQRYDAMIIACFDDTGLEQARLLSERPVIGIGQAAFHASMLMGHPFSVVTTLSVSVPVIESNIRRWGVDGYCKAVRASDVAVLDLEKVGSAAENKISEEISHALQVDQCGAIVLGCAGMTHLANRLTIKHQTTVIDGVVAAAGFAVALARTAI